MLLLEVVCDTPLLLLLLEVVCDCPLLIFLRRWVGVAFALTCLDESGLGCLNESGLGLVWIFGRFEEVLQDTVL